MGYEAQIAGINDDSWLMRLLKWFSIPGVREKRREITHALERDGFKLEFVNGGGSGSIVSVVSC